MGHIDYCSLCKYVYTKDCNYGSKECNQEKARIMLEVSRFEKMGAADVQPVKHGRCKNGLERMKDEFETFGKERE